MDLEGNEGIAVNLSDLTAEQCLSTADALYVDENYSDAIDSYAAALSVVRESETLLRFRILSHRSGAFYNLGRYEEALEDAQTASKILSAGRPLSGLLPGESEACSRREGLASFKLQRYRSAQAAFEKAGELASLNKRDTTTYQEWIRQCKEQLEPKVVPSNSATSTSAHATPQPLATSSKSTTPASSATATAVSSSRAPTSTTTSQPTAPRYQYYQNDKFMTVCIMEPNVKPEDLDVAIETKRLTVIIRKAGIEFTLIAGPLYEEVNTDLSKWIIKEEKVLIKLRKIKAFEWNDLLGREAKKKPPPLPVSLDESKEVPTADPSKPRPYSSYRDWDSIEKNLEAEEENEKPEGDDAMNKLFQSIYANADEDTRRAMIKSYQTSGGTVLSTNWGEVSDKDYEDERTAPKGMEWKTWEGDKLPMEDDD